MKSVRWSVAKVEATIRTVDPPISYKSVSASRGKVVQAEPISALYEQGKVHHVARLDVLENEMVSWQPEISSWSPNRVDALVWVLTELMLGEGAVQAACIGIDPEPERGHRSIWDSWPDVGDRARPRIERPSGSIWDRDVGRGLFRDF